VKPEIRKAVTLRGELGWEVYWPGIAGIYCTADRLICFVESEEKAKAAQEWLAKDDPPQCPSQESVK